jgi:phage terminase large subunit-like protein
LKELHTDDKKKAIRIAILTDLYFLVKFVFGYWWLCYEPHKEFCEEIEKDKSNSLYLLPRGHCKTQIFNTGHTLQCYLKQPKEPIGIFCDIQKRASWKLRPLKYQLETNKCLKECFPDILYQEPKRESPMWNQEEIILPGHDGRQEPSVGVYGLDNQPTSLHFPRIKGDDLVTDKSVTTAEQLKKNIDSYGLMRSSILQASGNIQICGTIYDDGDLHRTLEDSGIYKIYKRPAEWKENGERKTLWPVQYGPDKLDDIKSDPAVSVYIYSCNYLLDPAPEDENAFFQLNWFPRYKKLPDRLQFYAAADLAVTEKETSCETSIAIVGVDHKNEIYLAEIKKGHWGSIEIINNILDTQREYKPLLFTIEAENIARTIMPFLKLKMREENVWPNLEMLLPAGDKIAKARPFQGRSKEGAIHLPFKDENSPGWLFDLLYQIRKFPRAKDKDIIDSIALLCYQLARQWGPGMEDKIKKNQDRYSTYMESDEVDGWRIV